MKFLIHRFRGGQVVTIRGTCDCCQRGTFTLERTSSGKHVCSRCIEPFCPECNPCSVTESDELGMHDGNVAYECGACGHMWTDAYALVRVRGAGSYRSSDLVLTRVRPWWEYIPYPIRVVFTFLVPGTLIHLWRWIWHETNPRRR